MAALCASLAVLQVAAAQAEKRVALVIGNAAYRAVAELPNPLKDARDMAAALHSLAFAGGKQRPFEYGSLTGQDLFFKPGAAVWIILDGELIPRFVTA
jgi:hypothetical protein